MPELQSLPTTLLTGFLGSGKTTLLRRVLGSPEMSDTAVVINEIGDIGIDHHLVDFVEGGVIELPGGCLCCAVREDLARSLRSLLERRLTGQIRAFRRLVIETTGLADPSPILYTLGTDPMLDHCVRLSGVVTVVDATTGAATLDRFPEAARQAALADTLAISKTDLAPFGTELASRLGQLNNRARRVLVREVSEAGDILFGAGGGVVVRSAAAPAAAHSHGIDAFAIQLGRTMSRLDFAQALGGLARARGYDLLRVKGIVEFADRPDRPALVQAAQHAMFAPEWLDGWPAGWPPGEHRSRLVFVVHDLPRAEILAHFASAEPALCLAPEPTLVS